MCFREGSENRREKKERKLSRRAHNIRREYTLSFNADFMTLLGYALLLSQDVCLLHMFAWFVCAMLLSCPSSYHVFLLRQTKKRVKKRQSRRRLTVEVREGRLELRKVQGIILVFVLMFQEIGDHALHLRYLFIQRQEKMMMET
jgi:hypothetical protein